MADFWYPRAKANSEPAQLWRSPSTLLLGGKIVTRYQFDFSVNQCGILRRLNAMVQGARLAETKTAMAWERRFLYHRLAGHMGRCRHWMAACRWEEAEESLRWARYYADCLQLEEAIEVLARMQNDFNQAQCADRLTLPDQSAAEQIKRRRSAYGRWPVTYS